MLPALTRNPNPTLTLSSRPAATFTTNALITEVDASFDGQDIVGSGATLSHWQFVIRHSEFQPGSLLLTNGAVLTHSSCTTTITHKLHLAITNDLVVSANGRSIALTSLLASGQAAFKPEQRVLQAQGQLLPLVRVVVAKPAQFMRQRLNHLRQVIELFPASSRSPSCSDPCPGPASATAGTG